jgi:hypothetical protein
VLERKNFGEKNQKGGKKIQKKEKREYCGGKSGVLSPIKVS